MRHATAAAAGTLVDHLIGELPFPRHPVALFGSMMEEVERHLWRDRVTAGAGHLGIGLALGWCAGWVLRSTMAATAVTAAGNGLARAALDVAVPLEAGDLAGARARLPSLVGRDPESLDAAGVARAVVESVAENTVDAVVAPAFWAAAAGPRGACMYRAVNTLDSMVGHRTPRFVRYGRASARADDAANWIPARLTAALVVAARPRAAAAVWRAVRRDAPAHPSPNAGVAEAAFAAALGVRLGGVTVYGGHAERRPDLGAGRAPDAGDIVAAVTLSRDVTIALVAALLAAGRGRWR
jgi:adenosylcobinamide-phosphate synthase